MQKIVRPNPLDPALTGGHLLTRTRQIVANCLEQRTVLAKSGKEFASLVKVTVIELDELTPALCGLHERDDVFTLVACFLEISRLQRLVNRDKKFNDRPLIETLPAKAAFDSAEVVIPLISRDLERAIPRALESFLSRYKVTEGIVGLHLMRHALLDFLGQHRIAESGSDGEPRIKIFQLSPSSYAGQLDAQELHFFCNEVSFTADCIAFFLDDKLLYDRVRVRYSGENWQRSRYLRDLIEAGRQKEALLWVDKDIGLDDLKEILVANGRIENLLGQLTVHFFHDNHESGFNEIVGFHEVSKQRKVRSQLLNAVRMNGALALGGFGLKNGFELFISEREWFDVELTYFRDPKPFSWLLSTSDIERIVSLLEGDLPEVACGILRAGAEQVLIDKKRPALVQLWLSRAEELCPMPERLTPHEEFLCDLAKKYPARRLLQAWIKGRP